MHIYQHYNLTTHYTCLSHHWFSHRTQTQTISLPERCNLIQKYVKMWKSNPILCRNMATRSLVMPERGNQSQLACTNVTIRSQFTHQNLKCISKIIHLHHDFMATSFIQLSYNKCDQYYNNHIHTSITMKQEHAYIIQS